MSPLEERLVTRGELEQLLGASIGLEKAAEVLRDAAGRLALEGDAWPVDQAFQLLDFLAKTPGLVGAVARFAKVRLLLRPE